MQMKLAGKNALVTGGSRGIGREIAKALAAQGARVIIHYHKDKGSAEKTLDALSDGAHLIAQADLADSKSIGRLAEEAISRVGRVDILINNAGIYVEHPLPGTGFNKWEQDWAETLYTNLVGPAHLSYFIGRHMIEKGGGRIINVSSRGAFRGEPDAPAYGASKAGLNSMSQSLAKALAPYHVLVFAVAPGFVETDMVAEMLQGSQGTEIKNQSPLRRAASAMEIAELTCFLATAAPEYMTGSIIDINGASYLRS